MQNTVAPGKRNQGKAVLAIIITLTIVATILFWIAIKAFQLQGLPLYFSQLGLYLVFFVLAFWGMSQEQVSLPVTRRLVVEALAWSVVGWLVFVILIQLVGLAQLSEELLALQKTPFVKIGMRVLSTWIFVGLGEEVLFRGYFLKAFWRHFTLETARRRMISAALLAGAFFSLWHLPAQIVQVMSGESDWATLLVSLVMLFLLGLGFTWLFVRSGNIILAGLVHGLLDYPLVGKNTQVSFIILLAAIVCVEIYRLAASKKLQANSRVLEPGSPEK